MSYRTNRHSCYDLEYHLVVVTKYRHPVIDGAFKDRLTELTYRIFEENFQCYVNEINTDKDHIHILFEAPPPNDFVLLGLFLQDGNGKTTQKRIRRIPCSVLLETLSLESFVFCLHCE